MSNYVVRRTSKWSGTVTSTTVDECNTMEDALNLMETYRKEEQGLVDADWCHVTGFRIDVDEKWDGDDIVTIATVKGGDYEV
jgi:hypothetical protein